MVNNNNLITQIENKKPVELVQELKDEYKIPSFEEFMKTYKNDDNLNYDDLKGGNIDEAKKYGPCSISTCPYPNRCFYVKIGFCLDPIFDKPRWSFKGNGSTFQWITMHNIEEAREVLRKFSNNHYTVISEFKAFDSETDVQKKQEVVLSKIRAQINLHSRGENVYEANLDLYKVTDIDPLAADYNGVGKMDSAMAILLGIDRGEINSNMATILLRNLKKS